MADVCPVCRTELEPTWWKPVDSLQSAQRGSPLRQIPMDFACPNDCINQVTPAEWSAAIKRLDAEQQSGR